MNFYRLRLVIFQSRKFLTNNFKIVRCTMSSKPTVLVTRSDFPSESIKLIESKCDVDIWEKSGMMPREELLKRIPGKDALFCVLSDKINSELLDTAGKNLKVIGTMSVGYDHIDLEECKKRGVLVGNTPDVLTDAVAELTIALLLATSRRLVEAAKAVTSGGWTNWTPLWMCGTSLSGSTVGIVGLGRIGFAVAERLKSFKVKLLYSGNSEKPIAKEKLDASFVPFDELLAKSDCVIVCAALTPSTRNLFDIHAFQKMKKSSIFINSSRGLIVNHDDLYTALTTGLIKAVGLDVMDPEPLPPGHKLTKLVNCVLLPHIGSATVDTRINMAVLTANNVLAGLSGKPLPCPL